MSRRFRETEPLVRVAKGGMMMSTRAIVLTTLVVIAAVAGVALGGAALGLINTGNFRHVSLNVRDLVIADNSPTVIPVGSTREYKTITEALARFNGRHAGRVTLKLDKETFTENIEIGPKFSSVVAPPEAEDGQSGVEIVGDERLVASVSFMNGQAHVSAGVGSGFSIAAAGFPTIGPGVDTRRAPFGPAVTYPFSLSAVAVNAETLLGCDPPSSPSVYAGNIVLVKRGVCGFTLKTKNAQDGGAVAVILYDSTPDGGLSATGGTDPTITIQTIALSFNNGNALAGFISTSSGPVTVTIAADTEFFPLVGAPFAPVTFVSTANPKQVEFDVLGLDLESIGLEAGDIIKFVYPADLILGGLYDNSLKFQSVVTAVSTNLVSFVDPLPLGVFRAGTTAHVAPNRVIQNVATARTPIVSLIGSGLTMKGITVRANDASAFRQVDRMIYVRANAALYLENCAIDGNEAGAVGLTVSESSACKMTGQNNVYHASVVLFDGSTLGVTILTIQYSSSNMLGVNGQSMFIGDVLRIAHGQDLSSFGIVGLFVDDGSVVRVYVELMLHRHQYNSAFIGWGSQLIVQEDATFIYTENGIFSNQTALYLQAYGGMIVYNRGLVSVGDFVTDASSFTIFNVMEGSVLHLAGATVDYTQPFPAAALARSDSTSTVNYGVSAVAPNNVKTYAADGEIDGTVNVHRLSTTNTTIEMSTSLNGPFIASTLFAALPGTTHTVINEDGSQHVLACVGCTFIGDGVTAPSVDNVLTFGVTTSKVQLIFLDATTVHVMGSGFTTSTSVRRRTVAKNEKRSLVSDNLAHTASVVLHQMKMAKTHPNGEYNQA